MSVRWGFHIRRKPLEIDDNLRGLIKELGDAINGALSQSVEINSTIQNVRDAGYEVVLALEATIGFNKKSKESSDESTGEPVTVDAKLRVTSQDLKFLQSLKISIEDLNDH